MANNYERKINPSWGREFWNQKGKRKEKGSLRKATRFVFLILSIIQKIEFTQCKTEFLQCNMILDFALPGLWCLLGGG